MIALALAVYHEARRLTRLRALGTPCPSAGDPYGPCESCAEQMAWAVEHVLRHLPPEVR